MSTIRPDFTRTSKVIQPNFNRYHHAHRSPMSTEKLNLEAQQFKYEVYQLYKIMDIIESSLNLSLTENFSGCVLDHKFNAEATVTSITGLDDIIVRVNNMERRLINLERGL